MEEINCGMIRLKDVDSRVSMHGWCRLIRDHGGKLFIDLADRYGMTQLVFDASKNPGAWDLGREYVITAEGTVRKRDEDTVDKKNPTGDVEVHVESFEIISKAEIPPFELIEEKKKFLADEELRLRYRYIDLRREEMVRNITLRHLVMKGMREFFYEKGFLELEMPILVKDTYETGSRTFLVPSRVHKGSFYSLAQSPQIYKQMSMIGGLDKYFQIVRCFRDEDPREDRQPEFTQLDLEVSFKDEKYIQGLIEEVVRRIFKNILNTDLPIPFPHLSYADAVNRYGSDKPDLRFGMEIKDFTEAMKESDYQIIKRVISNGGRVKGFAIKAGFNGDQGKINKNYMLKLIESAKALGLAGLTWTYVKENALTSDPESITKSIGNAKEFMVKETGAQNGDIIIFSSDLSESLLLSVLGKLRKSIGDKLGEFEKEFSFVWVDQFPLFEKDEVTGKLKSSHNPFTAPTKESEKFLDSDPEKVVGRQYDLALNGYEICGGSIRIHDPEMQRKVLEKINMEEEKINQTFGFLLEALSYGAPIHGGIAMGLDRFVALISGSENIRDFILFPKNKKQELLVDLSPTKISAKRLKNDYGISLEPDSKREEGKAE